MRPSSQTQVLGGQWGWRTWLRLGVRGAGSHHTTAARDGEGENGQAGYQGHSNAERNTGVSPSCRRHGTRRRGQHNPLACVQPNEAGLWAGRGPRGRPVCNPCARQPIPFTAGETEAPETRHLAQQESPIRTGGESGPAPSIPSTSWVLGEFRPDSPLPWYTSSPFGPRKSMVSPIFRLSTYWDIFPPAGNLGWVSLK